MSSILFIFVVFGRSRELLRTEFLKNKDEFRSEYLEKMYKDVDEVDEMLRFHLVQGHRETPEGNFGNVFNKHSQHSSYCTDIITNN